MQELVRAQKNVERFLQRKRTPPRKHRHVKKVAEELSLLGGILGGFFSLYSSFAEQCACYPYIFPTIFPHRRTTVYTDSRTVEKYREQPA